MNLLRETRFKSKSLRELACLLLDQVVERTGLETDFLRGRLLQSKRDKRTCSLQDEVVETDLLRDRVVES